MILGLNHKSLNHSYVITPQVEINYHQHSNSIARWYRELYRIVQPCNYRGQQQLPDPVVAMRGCCLRLIKLHEGVLARLFQVFTAVVNEIIKRL